MRRLILGMSIVALLGGLSVANAKVPTKLITQDHVMFQLVSNDEDTAGSEQGQMKNNGEQDQSADENQNQGDVLDQGSDQDQQTDQNDNEGSDQQDNGDYN